MKYKLYFGKTWRDWTVEFIKALIIGATTLVVVGLFYLITILLFSL